MSAQHLSRAAYDRLAAELEDLRGRLGGSDVLRDGLVSELDRQRHEGSL